MTTYAYSSVRAMSLLLLLAFRQFLALFHAFPVYEYPYKNRCYEVSQSGWTTVWDPRWNPTIREMLHKYILSDA